MDKNVSLQLPPNWMNRAGTVPPQLRRKLERDGKLQSSTTDIIVDDSKLSGLVKSQTELHHDSMDTIKNEQETEKSSIVAIQGKPSLQIK